MRISDWSSGVCSSDLIHGRGRRRRHRKRRRRDSGQRRRLTAGAAAMGQNPKNEGEGNRTAAREHNKETREFIEAGQVEKNAVKARTAVDSGERASLAQPEKEGLKKARHSPPAHEWLQGTIMHATISRPTPQAANGR